MLDLVDIEGWDCSVLEEVASFKCLHAQGS
jgi:hypothetical protein